MIEFLGILAALGSGFWVYLHQQNKKLRKSEIDKTKAMMEKKALEVSNDLKNMSDDELASNISELLKTKND